MDSATTLRPLTGRIIAVVAAVIALISAGSLFFAPDGEDIARGLAAPVLVLYLAWLMFWNPAVVIDDAGVVLVNVFRTVRLPWPAIDRIDTRWALELFTPYGKFTAWAAPAPGRHTAVRIQPSEVRNLPDSAYIGGAVRPGDVPNSPSGDASTIIRLRLDALRDAGHLDDRKLESSTADVRTHWARVAILAALVAAVVVSALL